MFSKYEIQNLISGIGSGTESNFIQTATRFLRSSQETGREASPNLKQSKSEEKSKLIDWCNANSYWISDIDDSRYLAEGAEQRVYLSIDGNSVVKLNDSIFYEYWIDYFNSLLLHNYFFPGTKYELLGFCLQNGTLYSVVSQPYIQLTEPTDLEKVKDFLQNNGFVNHRNYDYRNEELGIILEDIHDENVLTRHGRHFFIDTVFYLIQVLKCSRILPQTQTPD